MKKIITIILTTIMVFSFVACGNKEKAEKYCSSCGEGITKDAAFCEHCGADVGDTKTESEDNSSSNTTSTKSPESKEEEPSKPTEASKPTQPSKPSTPAHTHSYSKKVTAATCTGQGYTTHTCSCGHSYIDNYTNPSHSYSNYKCTKCGAVDKSNICAILKNWVIKYGTTNGDHTDLTIEESSGNGMCVTTFLQYNPTTDDLHFVFGATFDGNDSLTILYIPKNNTDTYKYSYVQYLDYGSSELVSFDGKITASSFTKNSPLSCENYIGDTSTKSNWIEIARQAMVFMLSHTDNYLTQQNVGINLQDMGFTSFQ